MQNLSDNDIDKLFKQEAEQVHPAFQPSDWDDMSARLDRVHNMKLYYRGTIILLIGIVMMTGWLIIDPLAFESNAVVEKDIKIHETMADREVAPSSSAQTPPSSDKESTEHADSDIGKTTLTEAKTSKEENEIAFNSSSATVYHSNRLADNQIEPGNTTVLNEKNPEENQIRQNDRSINLQEDKQTGNSEVVNSQRTEEIQLLNVAKDSIEKIDTLLLAAKRDVQDVTDSLLNEHKEKSKKNFQRIAVRATVSPDYSSDNFKATDKRGFNYGLVAEYFVHEHWSVSAGAIWSRKYYSAKNVEYSIYSARQVKGDCRMWDIPVNINYYIAPSRSFSIFASAGFTSYLMNNEHYDYEVETDYGLQKYSSEIRKENKEWFKMLNISIGLQKRISDRLSIQAEPFIKVPLAGVGDGNISLATFGSFFSVRYSFLSTQ